uniref:Uncharacterized protein n=1 Tax=Timema tahoe TaxID=61484 RepID=A0A7R9NYA4_9NEOP|nr:unnamed protein product [Timema tahoe]
MHALYSQKLADSFVGRCEEIWNNLLITYITHFPGIPSDAWCHKLDSVSLRTQFIVRGDNAANSDSVGIDAANNTMTTVRIRVDLKYSLFRVSKLDGFTAFQPSPSIHLTGAARRLWPEPRVCLLHRASWTTLKRVDMMRLVQRKFTTVHNEEEGRCFKYSKSVLVTGLDVAGVILLVAADNTTATNGTVATNSNTTQLNDTGVFKQMEPMVKKKKGVGVGRRPPDRALKNPGPGKRPAPSRRNVGGSAVNGRFVQPILAGVVKGFRSWGLKVPPVRKELMLDGKRSTKSPKADASVAAAHSRGNKPAGTAEASGATPTPTVKRATGESQRELPSADKTYLYRIKKRHKAYRVKLVESLLLPEACVPLTDISGHPVLHPQAWLGGQCQPAANRRQQCQHLEDRVIRFSRVDSSCESVGVEGLSSGPDLSLMRAESSQGSDDESEGSLAVKPSRRALDKVRKWWKSKGNNAIHASPQPDTSGSGPAHKAKGRIPPIILCDVENYSKVARVIKSKLWDPALILQAEMRATGQGRGEGNPDTERPWRHPGIAGGYGFLIEIRQQNALPVETGSEDWVNTSVAEFHCLSDSRGTYR